MQMLYIKIHIIVILGQEDEKVLVLYSAQIKKKKNIYFEKLTNNFIIVKSKNLIIKVNYYSKTPWFLQFIYKRLSHLNFKYIG